MPSYLASGSPSAFVATADTLNDNAWFPYSGASSHLTFNNTNLITGSQYVGGEQVYIGDGKGLSINHIGHSLVSSSNNPSITLSLKNLLHVPSITKSLVSVSHFAPDNNVFFCQ